MLNKTKSKPAKQTFRLVLNSVAVENSLRLIGRARTANKVAKSVIGKSRIGAYSVKGRAVFALITNFPEQVRIVNDFSTPGFILVKAPVYRFAVHAPINLLSRASTAKASSEKWQQTLRFAKMISFDHPKFGVIPSALQAHTVATT